MPVERIVHESDQATGNGRHQLSGQRSEARKQVTRAWAASDRVGSVAGFGGLAYVPGAPGGRGRPV